jgi:hypothetical protein
MAPGLHGSARTTPRISAELQASQETTRSLAARYGLNPKTVAKWRHRTTTADQQMGPSRPRSSVLTEAEAAIVVEFRRRTLLPLDDVPGCLRETIPKLSRSALHRCLRAPRHLPLAPRRGEGLAAQALGREQDRLRPYRRLRAATGQGQALHVLRPSDFSRRLIRLLQGTGPAGPGGDRVSKFAHVAFLDANTKANGAAFLRGGPVLSDSLAAGISLVLVVVRPPISRSRLSRMPHPACTRPEPSEGAGHCNSQSSG